MRNRLVAVFALVMCVIFAGLGFVNAQDKPRDDKAAGKAESKKEQPKEEPKKEEPKEEPKDEEKPLTKKEFDDLMEEIKTSWNKLKINARKKMGDKAAENADEIAAVAKKILRYDGPVLEGDNKGKKAREQDDYQKWVEDLEKAAKDYAKHARKSKWDKADEARDKINETCGACHDAYEPID
jgi:cysteinyl-tRNA synthetase